MCAHIPAQPLAPTTTVVANQVIVDWQAPSDKGDAILGYNIYLRRFDLVYATELSYCDGSLDEIIANT